MRFNIYFLATSMNIHQSTKMLTLSLIGKVCLLCGFPGPLVPGKVEGVRFGLRSTLLRVLDPIIPAVLLDKSNGFVLGRKVDLHIR